VGQRVHPRSHPAGARWIDITPAAGGDPVRVGLGGAGTPAVTAGEDVAAATRPRLKRPVLT